MISLTLRSVKGSRLTNAEVDTNFTNIRDALRSSAESMTVVTGTSVTATAGQHLILTNASATTVTLPGSPTAGDTVWITPANGRTDNVVARNTKLIMGLAENMTMNLKYQTACLRYVDATYGWRLV